jgi:hypothetical protein
MSGSSEHVPASSTLDGRCLDQLVGGDLPENERRALLLRLDSEPDGWRRCALAFLEAQTWREAFAPLGAAASADRPMPAPAIHALKTTPVRRLARWSALAACIAVAFTLGWAAKRAPSPETSEHPQAKAPNAEMPQADVIVPQVEQANTTEPDVTNAGFESVVAFWERQGYTAERQKKLVKVKLEDGRERQVQAQEVRLRFVGDRTY